ncbi:MAG TPA: glycosyltransferase [Methylomirabilota bacterium]
MSDPPAVSPDVDGLRLAYAPGAFDPGLPTGKAAHVAQFVAHAAALGHQVWTWPGRPLSGARSLPTWRLPRLDALRRMDAIYVRCGSAAPARRHRALALSRRLLGRPLTVWEFNAPLEYALLRRGTASSVAEAVRDFRRLGRGCDLAICVSDHLARYVRDQLGIGNVLTVPNGSDPELFRPDIPPVDRVERGDGRLNVAWIGSLDLPWHDVDLLRAAAGLLWERGAGGRVAFHLIGAGAPGLMRDMPPNVYFHGSAPYTTVPRWLAAMDVGLCLYRPGPADYSSPLKLFDYMASGLAVVGTPQPQLGRVFAELDQSDLLVPAGDPSALVDTLLRLAADRARVRRQGLAGRRRVIEFYNWRRVVRDTVNAIRDLRAAARHPGSGPAPREDLRP